MPQALPFIALGLSAAGTGAAMAGQLRQASYQKALAEQNAAITDQNATQAELRGQAEREQLTAAASQLISRQRAAAGTGGADVQSGSIVDTIASTRMFSRLDIERSQYNTDMEKRGYAVQGQNFLAQGEMAQMAGAYGATSSLLTGASNATLMAYGMRKGGPLEYNPDKAYERAPKVGS